MIESLLDLDRSLFVLLNQRWVFPGLDLVMQSVTSGKVLQVVAIVLFMAAGLRLRLRALPIILGILTAIAISNSTSDVVKSLVDRPRPFVTETEIRLLVGKGKVASFPSAHAANGAAAAVALAMILGMASSLRRWTVFGVFGLITLIGWSRIYVGAHYPSDVVVGWILGGLTGGLAGWMWRRIPPYRVVPETGRGRVDLYYAAIVVSVILAVFRMGTIGSTDQGLTPGEAMAWYAARYPLLGSDGSLGPTPPFMPMIAHLTGAIHSYESFHLRWPMPIVGLGVILGVLVVLVQIGMTRSMAGLVVLFLQSVPAINACHVWFTENMINGVPWVAALSGWTLWTLHRKPIGLALIAGAMILTLTDPRSLLLVGTSLWLLEHYKGDYISRKANWRSLVVGLGLLAGCLVYRFTRPEILDVSIWTWDWTSIIVAAGPGTILADLIAVVLILVVLVRSQNRRELLGLRRRILVLYCAGTALASLWLGSKAHVTSVVTMVVPAVIMVSQVPLLLHLASQSRRRTGLRLVLMGLLVLTIGSNVYSLLMLYDKDTVRRLPGDQVAPRWLTGWTDRVSTFRDSLKPSDRVVASDYMTAAALSHSLRQPVGVARVAPGELGGDTGLMVAWVDGTTAPLRREIVVIAPWVAEKFEGVLQRTYGGRPILTAVEDRPSTISLDRPRTIQLKVYQRRIGRPLVSPDPPPVAPMTMPELLVNDPVDL